ncbi:MAG TPA: efflux RND transporter permease subunit [Rhodothermales bacterium]
MKITDLSIKYRTSVVVLTVVLSIGGLLSYVSIPKESNPSIEIPYIVVTTLYPGASPSDIESLITQPIEEEISSVNGIDNIQSTSTEGVSSVVVEFTPDVSMDDAFQKVRDKVDIAKADLPSDVEEPMVSEVDLSEFPIMTINLAADYSLARLKEVAEDLEDELESIPSVLGVDLFGGLDREVQINVDLNALQGYNLAFSDLVETISTENSNIPGGSVDVDRLNYLVRVNGQFADPAEIENLVVKAPGGTPVYVRDVADVEFGFKERTSYSRLQVLQEEDENDDLVAFTGEQAEPRQVVSLNIKKRSGDNILETADEVRAKLAEFPLPPGTTAIITGDQSVYIDQMVVDLENNIISGLIFVVAILLFFLGVRNSVLVGIAIPLSMFISFIVFQAMGQTLNFIILFSLIIALGMLVDNAIVIVENIVRYREEGHSRFEAARLGTAEVGGPVAASTATTVAAFVPMMFWPGIIGEFMSFLPLTLIITLSCSLFVALVINPVLTGIYVKLDSEKSPKLKPVARRFILAGVALVAVMLLMANWRTLLVLGIGIPAVYLAHVHFFKKIGDRFVAEGFPRIVETYRRFLTWMLQRDYSVRRAYLRNTFSLVAFTLGFLLYVLGMVFAGFGPPVAEIPLGPAPMPFSGAGLLLFVPGAIILLVGVVGIVVHTFESVFIGGMKSVRAGLIFGAVMLAILIAMYISPTVLHVSTMVELMIMPGFIVAVGLLGAFFGRRARERGYIFLTDNRARLLNGALGFLVTILVMFQIAPTGVQFFPETDPNQINIALDAPLGTNIDTSYDISETARARIEALLEGNPESKANVKNMLVNVGTGGDVIFGGGAASAEASTITMNLVDYEDRPVSTAITLQQLRDQLGGIPGVDVEFTQDESGPPVGKPVNIEISGEDFAEISRISQEIKQRLTRAAESGEIPGLVDVADNLNSGRPEFRIRVDRERAARAGLNTSDIAMTVRSAINGVEAGKYRTGEDEYDIIVRLSELDRQSLESLRNLTVVHEGQQIPLVALADFEVSGGLGSITRQDQRRVATVTADAAPGFNGPDVLAQVQTYLAPYLETMPSGYSLEYTGENEEQDESFGFLTTALLVGCMLIFMIMVAQFNSVSIPFIIMVAVGLSLIGVLLGLILTRTPFGLFTFIGIISLAGVVVNNNIVLIDYSMQLRERGLSKMDAIVQAGATRLRPVLLTAMTTVLGLIPLTFGINFDFVGLLTKLEPNFSIGSANTDFWGPMGIAIISGLTFATFLTLVIVPVMYSAFDSTAVKLAALFGRKPQVAHHAYAHTNGDAKLELEPTART